MRVGHGVYKSALAMWFFFDDVEGVLVRVMTERIALIRNLSVQSCERDFIAVRTHGFVGLLGSRPLLRGMDCLERQVSRCISIDRKVNIPSTKMARILERYSKSKLPTSDCSTRVSRRPYEQLIQSWVL